MPCFQNPSLAEGRILLRFGVLCGTGVGLQGQNEYVTEQPLRGCEALAQGFETDHGNSWFGNDKNVEGF